MKIILDGRQSGKTYRLIQQAAKDSLQIVCSNQREAERVFSEAGAMGVEITFPLTAQAFLGRRFVGMGIRGFIIDNADWILQELASPVPVEWISLTFDAQEIEKP